MKKIKLSPSFINHLKMSFKNLNQEEIEKYAKIGLYEAMNKLDDDKFNKRYLWFMRQTILRKSIERNESEEKK